VPVFSSLVFPASESISFFCARGVCYAAAALIVATANTDTARHMQYFRKKCYLKLSKRNLHRGVSACCRWNLAWDSGAHHMKMKL
jgi:hypothetical protein